MASYTSQPGESYAGQAQPGAASETGVPAPPVFPLAPLDVALEIELNGTWTDVSEYLDHSTADSQQHPAAVTITRGRQDETATSPTPSTATFRLWNADGRFCTRNPNSPYYPYLTRNLNVRFSIPSEQTYLRIDADESSNIYGDADANPVDGIDLRVEFQPLDYRGSVSIIDKWSSGNQSWYLQLNDDGTLTFFWSTTGSDSYGAQSTNPIPVGHVALRVVWLPTAYGWECTFYTSPTLAADDWTQLGGIVSGYGHGSIYAGGVDVTLGYGIAAYFYGVQIYSGNGAVLSISDFSTATPGSSSFEDEQGNYWDVAGTAEFTDRDYRYCGQVSSMPVTWDPTGQDVWANLTASGPLQRLQQGTQPNVMSPMRRALQYQTGPSRPASYWPMEDGSEATYLAPAIGTNNMTWTYNVPTLASNSDFICSNPLPQPSATVGNTTEGVVFGANISTPAGYVWTDSIFRFLWGLSGSETNGAPVVRLWFTNSTFGYVELTYWTADSGSLELAAYKEDGTQIATTGVVGFGLTAEKNVNSNGAYDWRVSVDVRKDGSNILMGIQILEPGAADALSYYTTVSSAHVGRPTRFLLGGALLPSATFGHVSVDGAWDSLGDVAGPLNAWQGETAGARFIRLCGEANLNGRIIGSPARTVALGYQQIDTLIDLLQECEDADRGQIYEPRDVLGLAYRTLASMQDQEPILTLDYNLDQITPPLAPTIDDLYVINDVTVTQTSTETGDNGSFAEATLDDGSEMSIQVIGDYANNYELYLADDSQLMNEAYWILHVMTDPHERYPNIPVNLVSTQWQVAEIMESSRAADIGDHIQIINTPSFLPPGPADTLMWGVTEYLGDFCDEMNYNTVPEVPYHVGKASSPYFGRVDTDGSSTTETMTTTQTSVTVTSTTEPWTTYDSDLPFDVVIGGERMTVTGVTAPVTPDPFVSCSASYSSASAFGATCQVDIPAGGNIYVVIAQEAAESITNLVDSQGNTYELAWTEDLLTVWYATNVTALTAGVDGWDINFGAATAMNIQCIGDPGYGTFDSAAARGLTGDSDVASITTGTITSTVDVLYTVAVVGETPDWGSGATTLALTTGNSAPDLLTGYAVASSGTATAIANQTTAAWQIIATPFQESPTAPTNQTLTVTRSVNGIVKTQASGSAINLYQPAVAALTG